MSLILKSKAGGNLENYLLEMKNICKEFSGVKVLKNVNFNLKKGEVNVLLGENGAGKSTLIKILSGAYDLTSGEILINGQIVNIKTPQEGINLGISIIYQEFNLNPYMNIYENIFLGKEYKKNGIIDFKSQRKKAIEICNDIGLKVNVNTKVLDLSIAERQLVEIAKALSLDSKIIVFDEPTATLTDLETERLFKLIKSLKKRGIGIIYISHRMDEILKIGDRITVLRDGMYIGCENVSNLNEKEIIKMVAGKEVNIEKNNRHIEKNIVLEVNNLSSSKVLSNISFNLYKGEVLGVFGLVGSGRTELAKCLIGDMPYNSGEINLKGKRYTPKSPGHSIKNKIVYVSEDRKSEGLILEHSIKTNILLPSLKSVSKFGVIKKSLEKRLSKNLISKFNIKASSENVAAYSLSGGNQQKIVIAKWINKGADIYIIDEPTRGIDIASRSEIYSVIDEILEKGSSIIMISSDIAEIMKISNRILVMHEGKIVGDLKNTNKLTQETIIRHAMGREINYVI